MDIPTALTATNVQQLSSVQQQSVIVVAREDTIVSVIDTVKWADGKDKPANERKKKKPPYLPLSNLAFLHMLEKVWSGNEIDTRITISDRGVQAELLYLDDAFILNPRWGISPALASRFRTVRPAARCPLPQAMPSA